MDEILFFLEQSTKQDEVSIKYSNDFFASNCENLVFTDLLINVISKEEISEKTKLVAALQLKYCLKKDIFLNELSFEKFIQMYINNSERIQKQLNEILKNLIKFHFDNDNIQAFLELSEKLCSKNNYLYQLIGINIFKILLKMNNKYIKGIGNFNSLAKIILQFLINVLQINNEFFLQPYGLIKNELLLLNEICNYIIPKPLYNWINLLQSIFKKNEYLKEISKICLSLIEIHPLEMPGEYVFSIFKMMIENNNINLNYTLRYINQIIKIPKFYDVIFQDLYYLLFDYLYEKFMLNEIDIQIINENILDFILRNNLNSENDQFPTLSFLAKIIFSKYFDQSFYNILIQKILKEINDNNPLRIYGTLYFAGSCLSLIHNNFQEKDCICQILNTFPLLLRYNNKIITSSVFLFLSLVNLTSFDNINFLYLCLIEISEPSSSLSKYFAIISASRFLEHFLNHSELIFSFVSNNIKDLIFDILEFISFIQINELATAANIFINFFAELLYPYLKEITYCLFNLFSIYSQDDESDQFKESIFRFSTMMKNQNIDFFIYSISICNTLIFQLDCENYDSLFDIMIKLVIDTPEITDEFLQILKTLLKIIPNFSEDNYISIAKYMKCLFLKSPKIIENENIFHCLINISHFVITNINEYFDPYAIILLYKILFILYKDLPQIKSIFPFYLEFLTNIDNACFANAIASCVVFSYQSTLSNEYNLLKWAQFSTPKIFLYSAMFVLNDWEYIPHNIKKHEKLILSSINENLQKINENSTSEFYNVEEMMKFYHEKYIFDNFT